MSWRTLMLLGAAMFCGVGAFYYFKLQRELIPAEDRGILQVNVTPPVGSTPDYLLLYSTDVQQIVQQVPEMDRTFHRMAGNSAYTTGTLRLWEDRKRTTQTIIAELRRKFAAAITGVQVNVSPARPFGSNGPKGADAMRLVIQGTEFSELRSAGSKLLTAMRESGLFGPSRIDPSFAKPQLDVRIDRAKAADLNVSISDIAATLETMLGSRRVTEFQRGNQQYYVVLQIEDQKRVTPNDLARLYVRSSTGNLVQLSNLVTSAESAVPEGYPHFNRLRAMTVSGQLAEGVTIGDAVGFIDREVRNVLPAGYSYSWDGEARSYVESASDTGMLFLLALVFTFLILAAQFESWIHPITIFVGVLLALAGGVLVLYCTRFFGVAMTDNLFARFGLIMLIGLVAKNGILIVEFANQLQVSEGMDGARAARAAAALRFRPILMTSISTILGVVPIAFMSGAGAETRNPLGIVIVGGLGLSTVMTLYVVPIVYVLMDRLCIAATGRSSAAGLKRAEEIKDQTTHDPRGRLAEAALAK
jgi:multidrug efflux pump